MRRQTMKIVILGYSGSGKSTLARHFSERYQIPLLHLDQINYISDWQYRDTDEAIEILQTQLTKASWIIDGNYSNLMYQERLALANFIIVLQFSRWSSLLRVFKRTIKYYKKSRPDMSEGCPERFDLEFIWWILYAGRTKAKRKNYDKIKYKYHDKVISIKNQRQLNQLYQESDIQKLLKS